MSPFNKFILPPPMDLVLHSRLIRRFNESNRMDTIQKGAITRLLCDRSGITQAHIGRIDILREFSFFGIDSRMADTVLKSMEDAKHDGRDMMVQISRGKAPRIKQKKSSKKPRYVKF